MLDRLKKVFAARTPAPLPGAFQAAGAGLAAAPPSPGAVTIALDVNVYSTCVDLPVIDFPHRLAGARNRLDPDLAPHLEGFAAYVASRGDGAAPAVRAELLRHIRRTRWHANLAVDASHAQALASWATRANAVFFMGDGSVRDPQARLLLARDGAGEAQACVPAPEDARARRTRSDAALAAAGVAPAPPRPRGAAATEVQLRAPAHVVHRALALLLVAERAQALCLRAPMPVEALHRRLPAARRHLTPRELAFVANEAPAEAERLHHAHAHEALAILAWALMRTDAPALPAAPRDAARVTGIMLRLAAEHRVPRQLRPVGEILDLLDLHARAADCLRAASTAGSACPAVLDADVVRERHRALDWLVRGDEAHWGDDVSA
jgi:hypothetical protein